MQNRSEAKLLFCFLVCFLSLQIRFSDSWCFDLWLTMLFGFSKCLHGGWDSIFLSEWWATIFPIALIVVRGNLHLPHKLKHKLSILCLQIQHRCTVQSRSYSTRLCCQLQETPFARPLTPHSYLSPLPGAVLVHSRVAALSFFCCSSLSLSPSLLFHSLFPGNWVWVLVGE